MMIVGQHIDKVEIPHESNNFIHLRELSGLELDEAQELRSQSFLKKMGSLGKDTLDALRSDQPVVINNAQEPAANEIYDWQYIIDKAVTGWSGPNYDNLECNDANKKLFDKVTRSWLVDEILRRNTIPAGELLTSGDY